MQPISGRCDPRRNVQRNVVPGRRADTGCGVQNMNVLTNCSTDTLHLNGNLFLNSRKCVIEDVKVMSTVDNLMEGGLEYFRIFLKDKQFFFLCKVCATAPSLLKQALINWVKCHL